MFSGAASFNRLGRLVVWCCQLRLVPNLCRVVLVEGGSNDERVEVGRTVEHGTRGSAVSLDACDLVHIVGRESGVPRRRVALERFTRGNCPVLL